MVFVAGAELVRGLRNGPFHARLSKLFCAGGAAPLGNVALHERGEFRDDLGAFAGEVFRLAEVVFKIVELIFSLGADDEFPLPLADG